MATANLPLKANRSTRLWAQTLIGVTQSVISRPGSWTFHLFAPDNGDVELVLCNLVTGEEVVIAVESSEDY